MSGVTVRRCGLALGFALVALSLVMLGCSSRPSAPTPQPPPPVPTATPAVAATPEPTLAAGKGSVRGVLYNTRGTGSPIAATSFYLTPGRGEGSVEAPMVLTGPHLDQGDFAGESDMSGAFLLNNVTPGKYFLFVWAPYTWIAGAGSASDSTPRLIVVEAGQRQDIGRIYLDWP
jgi:hypothetical protein